MATHEGTAFMARVSALEGNMAKCQDEFAKHIVELAGHRGEIDNIKATLESKVPAALLDVEALKQQLNEKVPEICKEIADLKVQVGQTMPDFGAISTLLTQTMPEVLKNIKELQDYAVDQKTFGDFGKTTADQFRNMISSGERVQSAVNAIEARLRQCESGNRPMGQGGGSRHVANSKALNAIPMYTGIPKEYENWAQKMRNVLYQTNRDFRKVIGWIDQQKKEVNDVSYNTAMQELGFTTDEATDMAEQLWFLICVKTGTELLPTLNKLENDGKVSDSFQGPLAWWYIRSYAMGANLSRVQALNGRVYGPDRIDKEENLQYELDCWEADVRE